MIDLSDVMKPVDIRVDSSTGGYVIVECREALYNSVREELKNTAALYGIPIVFSAELAGRHFEKERIGTKIQLVAWEVGVDPNVLARKVAEYYQSKGMVAVTVQKDKTIDIESEPITGIPRSDWGQTPWSVKQLVENQQKRIKQLEQQQSTQRQENLND